MRIAVVAVWLFVSASAVGQVEGFEALARGDAQQRLAALLFLEDARSVDEAAWRLLLGHRDDPAFFAQVVRGLGRFGEPVQEKLLLEVLGDTNLVWGETLQRAAALAVGLIGKPELMPPLAARVRPRDVFFATGLMKKTSAEAKAAIAAMSRGVAESKPAPAESAETFDDVVEAALRWGAVVDEPALAELARKVLLAKETSASRIHAAIDFFARSNFKAPTDAKPAIRAMLAAKDPETAGLAARALAKAEGAGAAEVEAIKRAFSILPLTAAVDQLRALGTLHVPEASEAIRTLVMSDPTSEFDLDAPPGVVPPASLATNLVVLRRTGCESLATVATMSDETRTKLAADLDQIVRGPRRQSSMRPDEAAAAVLLLAAVGPAKFAALAPTLRLAEPWQVRAALPAAFVKADLADTTVLLRSFTDPDRRVRAAAFEAIAENPPFIPTFFGLIEKLNIDDIVEVSIFAKVLIEADATDVDAILLKAVERIPDHEVEALQSVLDLAGKTGTPASLAILRRYAISGEISLRKRAGDLLAKAGEALPESRPAPAESAKRLAAAVARAKAVTENPTPSVVIETSAGEIPIVLDRVNAPATVESFLRLAASGFYDGILWHRVVPAFVAQAGCPRGDGWGGPGYTIRCEVNDKTYRRGSFGMALAGKDTGGSQFFIAHRALPHLDGRYTLFGEVAGDGMTVVDQLGPTDVILRIRLR